MYMEVTKSEDSIMDEYKSNDNPNIVNEDEKPKSAIP